MVRALGASVARMIYNMATGCNFIKLAEFIDAKASTARGAVIWALSVFQPDSMWSAAPHASVFDRTRVRLYGSQAAAKTALEALEKHKKCGASGGGGGGGGHREEYYNVQCLVMDKAE